MQEGSVKSLKITVEQINEAFENSREPLAKKFPEDGDANELFVELYAAMVSVPSIGRSLLGDNEYKNLIKKIQPGEQAILLAGDGRFSFKGSGYVRGGIFDRFQIVQGDNTVRFNDRYHKRLRKIAATGAPGFKNVDLFRTPADSKFDPAQPWTLELLVGREVGPTKKAFLTFDLDYSTPEKYLNFSSPDTPANADKPVAEAPEPGARNYESTEPVWKKMWELKLPGIVVLAVGIAVLSVIFFSRRGWSNALGLPSGCVLVFWFIHCL